MAWPSWQQLATMSVCNIHLAPSVTTACPSWSPRNSARFVLLAQDVGADEMSICGEKRKTRAAVLVWWVWGGVRKNGLRVLPWQNQGRAHARACGSTMDIYVSIHVTPHAPCTTSLMFLRSNEYNANVEDTCWFVTSLFFINLILYKLHPF